MAAPSKINKPPHIHLYDPSQDEMLPPKQEKKEKKVDDLIQDYLAYIVKVKAYYDKVAAIHAKKQEPPRYFFEEMSKEAKAAFDASNNLADAWVSVADLYISLNTKQGFLEASKCYQKAACYDRAMKNAIKGSSQYYSKSWKCLEKFQSAANS